MTRVPSNKSEKIKNAVLKTVGEIGVAGLTMKKIGLEAAISPGTLYLYYSSKEQMVNQLFLELKQELALVAFEGLAESELTSIPFEDSFKVTFLNMYQYLAKHPSEQVFLQQGYRSPFVTEETKKAAEVYYLPIISMVENAQKQGIITQTILAPMLLAFINGVLQEAAQACLLLPNEQLKDIGEGAFNFCWNAIKTQ